MRCVFKVWIIGLMLVCFGSCAKMCQKKHSDMSPEEVVEAYLDVALNMTAVKQRVFLLQYTTGQLYEAINQVSDDIIEDAYITKKYKLKSYTVVERRDRTPRETEITFELIYDDYGDESDEDGNEVAKITSENTVSVVRSQGLWLIRNVLNKKPSFYFPKGSEIKADAAAQ